jgi:hypothetical protein
MRRAAGRPLVARAPAQAVEVPAGQVVNIQEHLVAALLVPDLIAGRGRVLQDRGSQAHQVRTVGEPPTVTSYTTKCDLTRLPDHLSLPGSYGMGTVGLQDHGRLLVNASSNTAGAIALPPHLRRTCFVVSVGFEFTPWVMSRRLR